MLFIKDHLKRAESGEGGSLKGLQLFLDPTPEDRHLYEAAIYYDEPGRFKNEEVQKVADDYAIDLPPGWTMEVVFDKFPAQAIEAEHIPAALYFATKKHSIASRPRNAQIKVMRGIADQELYKVKAGDIKTTIGREKNARIADGFLRVNTIAFSTDEDESNRFVSRQHAHIEWNALEERYFLYADEGGIPPRNKTKVLTADGRQLRLQTMQIGHELQDGDQVVLGESALLLFNYLQDEEQGKNE